MAATTTTGKRAVAAEVWRRWFDFFIRTRAQRDRVLADFGLTPNDARALTSLNARSGRTMRSLAEEWRCDASNVTWIVDRLERLGLAERRPHDSDRRVKLVALAPKGVRTKSAYLREIFEPPPELLALDRDTLELLRSAMSRLPER